MSRPDECRWQHLAFLSFSLTLRFKKKMRANAGSPSGCKLKTAGVGLVMKSVLRHDRASHWLPGGYARRSFFSG
jgi:hypothetical protein